jgi:hypothetical protein
VRGVKGLNTRADCFFRGVEIGVVGTFRSRGSFSSFAEGEELEVASMDDAKDPESSSSLFEDSLVRLREGGV